MSDIDERAKELFHTLARKGFKRDRSKTRVYCYEGHLKAAGRSVSVSVTFSNLEFDQVPELRLLEPAKEAAHIVAHLNASGALCFARNEDLVLDRYDVGGTALMCLELARGGLERALTHKNLEEEIAQEFPQHWIGTPFFHDIAGTALSKSRIYFLENESTINHFLLTDREEALRRFVSEETSRKQIIASSRPAFVFCTTDSLTFKYDSRQPQTLAEFLSWLEDSIPGAADTAISELAGRFPEHLTSLFVNAPNGCIGISVDSSSGILKAAQRQRGFQNIARTHANKIQILRHSGSRADTAFIFGRNMAMQPSLAGRRIALVGCGTIGSQLAKLLVHSGAGHEQGTLLLLDNQSLEPGNVGRHYLGTTSIGAMKANALKKSLLNIFPEANIIPVVNDAVSFLANLEGHDLIIDATGEEAVSISINHHFVTLRLASRKTPDILHIRLFGNGVAAQALLVDKSDFACFKCLRPDHGGNWRFSPLKTGVLTTQTVAACGEGQHVAYGIAASAIAAALALQVTLDWNSGAPSPRLRTVRVEKENTKEVSDKNPDRSPRCPACGDQTTR